MQMVRHWRMQATRYRLRNLPTRTASTEPESATDTTEGQTVRDSEIHKITKSLPITN